MNVLFVTYDFPYPANSGGKNRAFNLLKITAKNHNVNLYSYVREDYNPDFNEEITSIGVSKINVFKRKKLKSLSNIPSVLLGRNSIFNALYSERYAKNEILEIVKREKIDIVHYESTYTGFLMNPKLKSLGVKQILGTENIEFQLYFDYAKISGKFFEKPFINMQAARLKREEISMIIKADAITTITTQEASILEQLTGRKAFIVANGIDPKAFSYSYDGRIKKNLLFVGNFTYFPNVDAINFFFKSVLPLLNDDITLTIIGKQCKEKLKIHDKRVLLIDFVEDIVVEYNKADALVFPIRIGGGTNFKVLEAMSLGIPIIAHPDRLAGLKAQEGVHFLQAVTPLEYKNQLDLLYSNRDLRSKISKNGRALIVENYAWESIGHDLINVWNKTL